MNCPPLVKVRCIGCGEWAWTRKGETPAQWVDGYCRRCLVLIALLQDKTP